MDNLITNTYAPGLIGTALALILYGISTQQFFFYFTNFFSEDLRLVKAWSITLFVLETIFIAACMEWVYGALILDYGHSERLSATSWSLALIYALKGFMISLVQLFFAWRINGMTGQKIIVFIIVLSALVCTGSGIAFGILAGIKWPKYADQHRIAPLATAWNVSVTACDLIITSTLTLYFSSHRQELSSETSYIVNSIMKLMIQNSLLTTMVQFCNIFIFVFVPGGYFRIFFFICPLLFVSGALSSLNARSGWRKKFDQDTTRLSHEIKFHKPQTTMIDIELPSAICSSAEAGTTLHSLQEDNWRSLNAASLKPSEGGADTISMKSLEV